MCDFVLILVSGCCLVGLELGLVNRAEELLVPLGKASELLPSIHVKKIIVPGVDGTGDGIIGSNDGEGFGGYLPIFPFDGDIECRSLIFRGPKNKCESFGLCYVGPKQITL